MTPRSRLACVLLLALPLGTGLAQAKAAPEVLLDLQAAPTAEAFEARREQITLAIADKEAFAELRAADRKVVLDTLGHIGTKLEASGSVAALDDGERSALLQRQAELNSILETARKDSRLVCTREKTMGSNFRRSVCMTVAQRRRNSEQAQGMVGNQATQ